MPNPRLFLTRRKAAQSTQKITRTMELVATAKLQRAQSAAESARPYGEGLAALVATVAADPEARQGRLPLLEQRTCKKALVVVCCSDRGLCGSYNAGLIRLACRRLEAHKAAGHQVAVYCLGKKGVNTLRYLGYEVVGSLLGQSASPRFTSASTVADELSQRFLAKEFDHIDVVHSRFFTRARQAPAETVLLPLGASTAEAKPAAKGHRKLWIYEPAAEELLAALAPQVVRTVIYTCLLQTAAGEHAARRLAMKNATDNASQMITTLNRAYNRARQGKITQEIAEIVGAVEAMK